MMPSSLYRQIRLSVWRKTVVELKLPLWC